MHNSKHPLRDIQYNRTYSKCDEAVLDPLLFHVIVFLDVTSRYPSTVRCTSAGAVFVSHLLFSGNSCSVWFHRSLHLRMKTNGWMQQVQTRSLKQSGRRLSHVYCRGSWIQPKVILKDLFALGALGFGWWEDWLSVRREWPFLGFNPSADWTRK